jgi:tetrahydromethanopterin S-methyltransferase subunit B
MKHIKVIWENPQPERLDEILVYENESIEDKIKQLENIFNDTVVSFEEL